MSEHKWEQAVRGAFPALNLQIELSSAEELTALVLGERQFGPDHWDLGWAKRLYYMLKPVLPRELIARLRRVLSASTQAQSSLDWPIEPRYVHFQWEVMRQLLLNDERPALTYRHFWPYGRRFALVLTHDIESENGQAFAEAVSDLEESFGFRSSFNFVPEHYPLDESLMQRLRERGFEIGVHGLKHDGKLFNSRAEFSRRAARINNYLQAFGAVGFRAPLTIRHPEWMQALNVEYDLSFFDTDPYEPLAGGTMSIWPFILGHFVELPYTMAQDSTLTIILGEETPRLWYEKVDFIAQHHGMVLLNTHPDYLSDKKTWQLYADFLQTMKERSDYWHALPRDVAHWWRVRLGGQESREDPRLVLGSAELRDGQLHLDITPNSSKS